MFSKLIHIFLVLALGVLFAGIFSVPVRKINYIYGKNISFLKRRKKARNILAVLSWYGFLLIVLISIFGLLYFHLYQYFSKVSWNAFLTMITNTIHRILNFVPFISMDSFDSFSSGIVQSLMKLPGIIGKIVIALLISVYLLMDWDDYMGNLRKWRREYLPESDLRQSGLRHAAELGAEAAAAVHLLPAQPGDPGACGGAESVKEGKKGIDI